MYGRRTLEAGTPARANAVAVAWTRWSNAKELGVEVGLAAGGNDALEGMVVAAGALPGGTSEEEAP